MNVSDFTTVEQRLKARLGITKDTEYAKALGLGRGAYATRKSNGSIPYQHIIALCAQQQISLDWLFFNNQQQGSVMGTNAIININGHQQIQLGGKDFADTKEVLEIVECLRFAPKPFLDGLLNKLRQFRDMAQL